MDATAVVKEVVQLDERRRATQVELDSILSESNKLSKDIGELMKGGEKSKAAILKEKTILLKEKSKHWPKLPIRLPQNFQKNYILYLIFPRIVFLKEKLLKTI